MDIRFAAKSADKWEIELASEDHTLVNLLRELVWENKGEAAYRTEHPLIGKPTLVVMAKDPKKVLEKSADAITKLCKQVEKAFS